MYKDTNVHTLTAAAHPELCCWSLDQNQDYRADLKELIYKLISTCLYRIFSFTFRHVVSRGVIDTNSHILINGLRFESRVFNLLYR